MDAYNETVRDDVSPGGSRSRRTLLWQVFVDCLPWVLFLVIIYFLFFRQLRSPGGAGRQHPSAFGKSRAKIASQESTGVKFADVAGVKEAKEEVKEVVEFLRNPARSSSAWAAAYPRGVMLVGPPGTGKTLLARAIAGEAGVPFFTILRLGLRRDVRRASARPESARPLQAGA